MSNFCTVHTKDLVCDLAVRGQICHGIQTLSHLILSIDQQIAGLISSCTSLLVGLWRVHLCVVGITSLDEFDDQTEHPVRLDELLGVVIVVVKPSLQDCHNHRRFIGHPGQLGDQLVDALIRNGDVDNLVLEARPPAFPQQDNLLEDDPLGTEGSLQLRHKEVLCSQLLVSLVKLEIVHGTDWRHLPLAEVAVVTCCADVAVHLVLW